MHPCIRQQQFFAARQLGQILMCHANASRHHLQQASTHDPFALARAPQSAPHLDEQVQIEKRSLVQQCRDHRTVPHNEHQVLQRTTAVVRTREQLP